MLYIGRIISFFLFLFFCSCIGSRSPITIRWVIDESMRDICTDLARAYMENNPSLHIEIKLFSLSSSTVPSGDIIMAHTQLLETLIRNQSISPLKQKLLKEKSSSFFDSIIMLCRKDKDSLYAAPFMVDANAFFYRRDLLTAYNIPPPTTWDNVMQAIKKITAVNPSIAGLVGITIDDQSLPRFFLEALWSSGLDVITNNNDVLLELPQTIALLDQFKTCAKKKYFVFKKSSSEALNEFKKGTALFYYGPLSDWKTVNDSYYNSKTNMSFGFTAIPSTSAYEPHSILKVKALVISSAATQYTRVLDFINFLTSFPSQEILFMNDRIPAMKTIFEKSEVIQYKPEYKTTYRILNTAYVFPVIRITPAIQDILYQSLSAVFIGKMSSVEALYAAAQKILFLPHSSIPQSKPKKSIFSTRQSERLFVSTTVAHVSPPVVSHSTQSISTSRQTVQQSSYSVQQSSYSVPSIPAISTSTEIIEIDNKINTNLQMEVK